MGLMNLYWGFVASLYFLCFVLSGCASISGLVWRYYPGTASLGYAVETAIDLWKGCSTKGTIRTCSSLSNLHGPKYSVSDGGPAIGLFLGSAACAFACFLVLLFNWRPNKPKPSAFHHLLVFVSHFLAILFSCLGLADALAYLSSAADALPYLPLFDQATVDTSEARPGTGYNCAITSLVFLFLTIVPLLAGTFYFRPERLDKWNFRKLGRFIQNPNCNSINEENNDSTSGEAALPAAVERSDGKGGLYLYGQVNTDPDRSMQHLEHDQKLEDELI